VKLTDKKTEVKVDISFNMNSGVHSAKLIKVSLTRRSWVQFKSLCF
jgi:DNA polymerase sigma